MNSNTDGSQAYGVSAATLRQIETFLVDQRWFAGKSRTIKSTAIRAAIPLDQFVVSLVDVAYDDGGVDVYFMPLMITEHAVRDALEDKSLCRRLLLMIENGELLKVPHGTLQGVHFSIFSDLRGAPDDIEPVVPLCHDQSNSAIALGEKLFLKLFRRVEPGVNPDYEIARHLTRQGTFRRFPRLAGAIEFQPLIGAPLTLATLQEWVPNDGNAWQAMLKAVDDSLKQEKSIAIDRIELLGRRTAELHLALAETTDDAAFSAEPMTIDDCEALSARLRRTAEGAFRSLQNAGMPFDSRTASQVNELLKCGPQLVDRFCDSLAIAPSCTKTRIHGDYHLGQVLCQGDDFIILDFEGEPARTLAERRAKDSPLRDLAGMLRSFDYATYAALFQRTETNAIEFARLEPIARAWQNEATAAYLHGYMAVAAGASFLPEHESQQALLQNFFVVEKALYEVQYELNNRPAWLKIPLAGILSIADLFDAT